jgi:hypothetical protein
VSHDITTWKKFAREVRATQPRLLTQLPRFRDAILVTGCQRSGGTMLSRLITNSDGMHKFWFGKDEELDAGLILSGRVPLDATGRCCFQTTYLNECWREYLDPGLDYRMIWSLRNPQAVGYGEMDHLDRVRFQRFGIFGVPPIRRAAYAYKGKVSQLFELAPSLGPTRLTVLEYDDLVRRKGELLPRLYERIGLAWQERYAQSVSERSLGKKDALKPDEVTVVDRICADTYARARGLVNLA